MKKEEERLRREVEAILGRMEEIDRAEDQEYGDCRGDELPQELATREKRLEVIRRAKAELEAEARAKAEKEQVRRREKAAKKGKTYRPKNDPGQAVPRDKDQKNFTDPDSRIMKNANKAYVQAYNAQACVDAKTHIVVAAGLYNQAADSRLLPEQVEQIKKNTGRYPEELSADAAYFSAENLKYLEQAGIEAFIPPDKIRHSDWRRQIPYAGPIPDELSLADRMRFKLRTRQGRERYKNRQTSVEPVFGYIKEELGLRQFLLRRLQKVCSYWRFTCGVFNLMKLFRTGAVVQAG